MARTAWARRTRPSAGKVIAASRVRLCPPYRRVASSLAILLVANLFHPVDILAVHRFLNGDMRHPIRWRRPMPMLFTGRKPDDIAGVDFLNRPTQPQPDVMIKVWPSGCVCQAVRAPGSNVTLPPLA